MHLASHHERWMPLGSLSQAAEATPQPSPPRSGGTMDWRASTWPPTAEQVAQARKAQRAVVRGFLCLVACKLPRCSTLWGWSAWFFLGLAAMCDPTTPCRALRTQPGPLSPQWRQLDEVMVMCPQSALRKTHLARHSLAEDGRMEALTAALRLVIPGWLSFRDSLAATGVCRGLGRELIQAGVFVRRRLCRLFILIGSRHCNELVPPR